MTYINSPKSYGWRTKKIPRSSRQQRSQWKLWKLRATNDGSAAAVLPAATATVEAATPEAVDGNGARHQFTKALGHQTPHSGVFGTPPSEESHNTHDQGSASAQAPSHHPTSQQRQTPVSREDDTYSGPSLIDEDEVRHTLQVIGSRIKSLTHQEMQRFGQDEAAARFVLRFDPPLSDLCGVVFGHRVAGRQKADAVRYLSGSDLLASLFSAFIWSRIFAAKPLFSANTFVDGVKASLGQIATAIEQDFHEHGKYGHVTLSDVAS